MEMIVAEEGRTLLDALAQFFTADEWVFHPLEGRPMLRLGFRGQNGGWQCYAQAREEQSQVIFYSVMESNVPPEKRGAVAEYLTRANYGLYIGNFEMDFSDGEVRYKTSVDVEGGYLTHQMIKTLVYVNVMMMDKYLPGIMAVVYADKSPEEAVAAIEG
ncbi:MAG: YbjN domain-containing protein [Anaerolineae bacterium]|nr:YbjN domain-containing protein [Anaerolineae bacterium]